MAEMGGLQRSVQTFRRSGSSGLIWDEKFLSEEQGQIKETREGEEIRELRYSQSVGFIGMTRRSYVDGEQAFHTRDVAPALDPPSPKFSCCICCQILRKHKSDQPSKPRSH